MQEVQKFKAIEPVFNPFLQFQAQFSLATTVKKPEIEPVSSILKKRGGFAFLSRILKLI